MKKIALFFKILLITQGFGQNQYEELSGNYLLNSKTCKANLFIEKKGTYQLNINDKYKDSGLVHISKKEKKLYINFGDISSLYTKDTIVLQNSGNSMSPYIRFDNCDEKFIQLIKAKNKKSKYSELIKDLDNDKIKDTIFISEEETRIICKLSSCNFKEIKSKKLDFLNENYGIIDTKNGFEFYNNWMRSGYKNQFRYNPKLKKIQLIGMSRFEFGPANNDGSGESSVNLLTNQYIGKWSYYDVNKDYLVKMSEIRVKMIFPKIYLEDFSSDIYFDYSEKCSELYSKKKQDLLNKKE